MRGGIFLSRLQLFPIPKAPPGTDRDGISMCIMYGEGVIGGPSCCSALSPALHSPLRGRRRLGGALRESQSSQAPLLTSGISSSPKVLWLNTLGQVLALMWFMQTTSMHGQWNNDWVIKGLLQKCRWAGGATVHGPVRVSVLLVY